MVSFQIVSGFGGTFCLVLSFLYILGSVVLLAIATPWSTVESIGPGARAACLAGFIALSVAVGMVPLRLGLRRVRTFEF